MLGIDWRTIWRRAAIPAAAAEPPKPTKLLLREKVWGSCSSGLSEKVANENSLSSNTRPVFSEKERTIAKKLGPKPRWRAKIARVAMPRGSKPGERRGGRKRGTLNKKTVLRNSALAAATDNPNLSPLDFLLAVMRDPNWPFDLRFKVAKAAARLLHPKLGPDAPRESAVIENRRPLAVTNQPAKLEFSKAAEKKTAHSDSVEADGSFESAASPLDFLLSVMRDAEAPPERRVKVAKAAAPFVHSRPRMVRRLAADATGIAGVGQSSISPAIANTLRDDLRRLTVLLQREFAPQRDGARLTQAESEEQSELRARIAATARAIECPPGYGSKQARYDRDRLHDLECKRGWPVSGGILNDVDDAEEAQLMARLEAFNESPEGRDLRRYRHLLLRSVSYSNMLNDAEQIEYKGLQQRFDEPVNPDHPLYKSILAWRAESKKFG